MRRLHTYKGPSSYKKTAIYLIGQEKLILSTVNIIENYYPMESVDRSVIKSIGDLELVGQTAMTHAKRSAVIQTDGEPDYKAPLRALLKAAGVRSWKALMSNSRYCALSIEENRIGLSPTVVSSDGRGFEFLPDDRMFLELDASDAEIGQAVIDALHYADKV